MLWPVMAVSVRSFRWYTPLGIMMYRRLAVFSRFCSLACLMALSRLSASFAVTRMKSVCAAIAIGKSISTMAAIHFVVFIIFFIIYVQS